MDFSFSPEQDALRTTVRSFLDRHVPPAVVRAAVDERGRFDADVWRRLGDELGVHGIHLPEEAGGQGWGHLELAVVCEELGAALAPVPYVASTVLAGTLLSSVAGTSDVVADVASGRRIATIAMAERGTGWNVDRASTTVVRDGRGSLVHGQKVAVPYGLVADLVVVVARDATSGEPVVAVVDTAADAVKGEWFDALDLLEPVARLQFDGTPATVLAAGDVAAGAIARTLDVGAAMLAATMVGGARRCLENAVRYATERRQFGRTLGSFQAIKHLCVDMLVEVELATAVAHHAAWALDAEPGERRRAAAMAKSLAGDAYVLVADAALHVHGGIGFTWEHDSHLHLRRARSASTMLGDPRSWREAFLRASAFDGPGRR